MKLKKLVVSVLTLGLITILKSKNVYAILPKPVYNPVNVTISKIMTIASVSLAIIYFLIGIIYWIKSNKDKKARIKRLVIWLIIIAIISVLLYWGADIVYEAGASYSYSYSI